VARMQRHGGSAEIVSGDDGTEVRLRLPRSVAA
jgi:signal transduction histidine kinase